MPISVPRINTHRLYSQLTAGRATGRLRLVEYPEAITRNPYEIPIPSRIQVILDVPVAAIKLINGGQSGDRSPSGNLDAKMYRLMVNRIDNPELFKIGSFAIVNWAEKTIQGVLDRVDPKAVSERFHLFIDAAQNVPFDPVNLGA